MLTTIGEVLFVLFLVAPLFGLDVLIALAVRDAFLRWRDNRESESPE